MAIKDAGVHCTSADFTFNGGDITVPIPDGNYVSEVIVEIITAFDGTGLLTVGYTGDTDAFLTDTEIVQATPGSYRASEGNAAKANGYRIGTGEDVIIDVTPGTATAGAGKVYVYHAVIA